MTTNVLVDLTGCVATLTLNRPDSYNAFDTGMRRELAGAISRLNADPVIRIVILCGAGRGFSAGVDLKERTGTPSDELLEYEFRPCLEPIWNSGKIFIAAVHGHAAGIAAAFVLACDLVVMEEDANLTLAFAAIGLIPDGGLCWSLTQAIGPRRALAAILESKSLDAQICLDAGLTNKIVPKGTVIEMARDWATELAAGAPMAANAAKALVAKSMTQTRNEVYSAEAVIQMHLAKTADHDRGVKAFLNRTKPHFQGD